LIRHEKILSIKDTAIKGIKMFALKVDMTETLYSACVFFIYHLHRQIFQFVVSKLTALGVGCCQLTVSTYPMFQNLLYRWQEAHTKTFFLTVLYYDSCTECRITLLKSTKTKRKRTDTHITGLNLF